MRKEQDAMGVKRVPYESYGGIFSLRAKENFQLSNRELPSLFFKQLALLKCAAAIEHVRAKRLDEKVGKAIIRASREIMAGKFSNAFDLDVFQAGAGTPFNMTMNEVIANRALEIVGQPKGKYSLIHPHTHVNMMQSSNDVIPTVIRLTTVEFSLKLEHELIQTIHLAEELSKKYKNLVKVGRTHMQTAVPITFGQELFVYAESLRDALKKIRSGREGLYELPLGGTAVGTGITTEPGYDIKVVSIIRKLTKQPYYPSHRKMLLTSHLSTLGHYSNALSELADELLIWANDWILLGSDPYAGIGEIHLPAVEPGSSIMPGKINPSILEALKMVTVQVQGNHETIRLCEESTQLELNTMTPILAANLFESQEILTNGLKMFREKCLKNVQPTSKMKALVHQSYFSATALDPYFGYDVTAYLVKKAMHACEPFEKMLVSMKLLTPSEAKILLSAESLTSPRRISPQLKKAIQSRKVFTELRKRVQKFSR